MKRLFFVLYIGSSALFAQDGSGPVVKDETDKTDIFGIPVDLDEQEENSEIKKLEKLQQYEQKKAAEAKEKKAEESKATTPAKK